VKNNASVFLEKLMQAYYSGVLGPHLHEKFKLPKNAKTKEEKARYLFYSISLDYGVRAEKLFEKMRSLYSDRKELFDPLFLSSMKKQSLVKLMQELRMRFPRQAAERWKRNSQKLIKGYDGRVLNVFKGDADEILQKLREFYGFGDKLSRLLLRVMVERGIIKQPKGFERMSIPTDIHDVKLAYRAGLLREEPDYSKHAKKVREAWTRLSLERGFLPADVDRALWVLGAEWCYKKRCDECPVKEECLKKERQ